MSMLPIGTIVQSFLPLEIFLKLQEGNSRWVVADGSKMPDGRLRELVKREADYFAEFHHDGSIIVPDLRGVFLRGHNQGRADQGDPDGEKRKIGSFQSDDLGRHDHWVSKTYPNLPNAPDKDAGRRTLGTVGWDGYEDARTKFAGGDETRPKNVAVNFFVRID
ncbi:hypothetical protein ACJ4V0_20790 [Phreatobacter sp. HK31-P]